MCYIALPKFICNPKWQFLSHHGNKVLSYCFNDTLSSILFSFQALYSQIHFWLLITPRFKDYYRIFEFEESVYLSFNCGSLVKTLSTFWYYSRLPETCLQKCSWALCFRSLICSWDIWSLWEMRLFRSSIYFLTSCFNFIACHI